MNTGGPAYPQHGWSNDPKVLERMKNQGGMTLLDWMAGQALEKFLEAGVGFSTHPVVQHDAVVMACAALAKAKGSQ